MYGYISNRVIFSDIEIPNVDPCYPSPCGSNALCNDGVCTCLPEYQGDPYTGCRPECVINDECPRNKACINYKCKDPCPGTCGQNAICDVYNHIPMCRCPEGMSGNAFVECRPYQSNNLYMTNLFLSKRLLIICLIISCCSTRSL